MALPNRDAERLDHALDAQLQGREENQNDSYAGLLTTFGRLQAMNEQVGTDATLRNDLWRSMMSTVPLSPATHFPVSIRPRIAGGHNIPLEANVARRRQRRPLLHMALTIALLGALVFGAIGYRQFGSSDDGTSIPAPMAAQLSYQGPDVADCTSQPRDPGAVEDLAGQEASEPAVFPRFGPDPSDMMGKTDYASKVMSGSALLALTGSVTAIDPNIYAFLKQLNDCSAFLLSNSSDYDLNGRYYALFSDDFFRREFAGYKEVGAEIRLTQAWIPGGQTPEILGVRALGDRVAVILDRSFGAAPESYVVLVLAKGAGGWQVDEIGGVGPSAEWSPAGTPAAPMPVASPLVGLNYSGPLEDGYVLFDKDVAGEPRFGTPSASTVCDALPGGADLTCGWYSSRLGPWRYNEYPADTDFTVTFSNIANESKRVEINALGVSVVIDPNETVPIVINAAPGSYLFEIFDGDSQVPLSGGVLYFNAPGQSYGMG